MSWCSSYPRDQGYPRDILVSIPLCRYRDSTIAVKVKSQNKKGLDRDKQLRSFNVSVRKSKMKGPSSATPCVLMTPVNKASKPRRLRKAQDPRLSNQGPRSSRHAVGMSRTLDSPPDRHPVDPLTY